MKRTLLITQDYAPMHGGVARYYSELVNRIKDMHVLTNVSGSGELSEKVLEHPLYFNRVWPRWIRLFFVIPKYIKRLNIQHVCVGQVLPIGTVVACLNAIGIIPEYSVFTHGMDVTIPARSWRKRLLLRFVFSRAAVVITNSSYTKKQLLDLGVLESKIRFVYPSVTKINDFVQPESDDAFKLLTVGRLVRRKGIDTTLEALKDITTERQIEYTIIGNGPDFEYLVKKTSTITNPNISVRLLGSVTDEELANAYRSCDAFIMPSRQLSDGDVEGFGIVFIEANAYGKPVIGGNSGGIPDAISHEETGLLVDANKDAVRLAILRLADNPEFASQLGRQGRARVATQFTWDIQAEKLTELLT